MGMPTGSICSKHDRIMDTVSHLQDQLDLVDSIDAYTLQGLRIYCEVIWQDAKDAKADGERMEDALYERRKTIDSLESNVSDLESKIEELESFIADANKEILEIKEILVNYDKT